MDESKLTSLITKLETYSAVNPRQYRLRVVLVAALGYAYLATVVIGLLAIVVGSLLYVRFNAFTIKVLWIPLVLVGLILRSLWITIPVPDGAPLNESDAKELFDLIRGLEKELNGPRVHTILVSDEMNAGIVQIPRFGMFGWLKNYLVVGLPLLSALRPDELRAVLAHEFGHLSGKHGRFSGWIYRVRESWTQILTAVHNERSYASFLFEPFLNWYAPFFKAYSFVLARRQEYEADALASKIAGKVTAARALVQIALTERSLSDEFWPAFYRGARERPQPPKDPFGQLVKQVGQSPALKATKWLKEELRIKTGYDDTHPSLADRLVAMGLDSESLNSAAMLRELLLSKPDEATSAADYYIQGVPEEFIDRSNRLLREQIAESWRQRFTEIQEARKELAKLDKKAESEPLSADEQWQRIKHLADVEEKEALPDPLRKLLAAVPNHAGANFVLGMLMLEQGDGEGIRSIETAIELDPSYKANGYGLISNFYLEQGEIEKADDFLARAQQYYDIMQRLNDQLNRLSPDDRFESHGLTDEQIIELKKQLIPIHGLEHAFLVRKVVDPMGFVFVLGVIAGYTWRDGHNDKHINALLEDLASTIQLSHPTVFVSLDAERYLLPLLSNVAAASVFSRQGAVEAGLEIRH